MVQPLFDALPFDEAAGQLRDLWRSAFGDDDTFIDAFFAVYGNEGVAHTLSLGGRVVAALYALPCNVCSGGASYPAAYIYAVATRPDCRGRGYMRLLLEKVETLLAAQGCRVLFLLPADDALRSLYSRVGYAQCSRSTVGECAAGAVSPAALRIEEVTDVRAIYLFWRRAKSSSEAFVLQSPELLQMNINNCRFLGGGVYAAVGSAGVEAVAFVAKTGGEPVVLDSVALSAAARESLYSSLLALYSAGRLRCVVPGKGEPQCMARIIGAALPCDIWDMHITLMLDK